MDSAVHPPQDFLMTPVDPVRGEDNVCPSRWMLVHMGPSTRTTDGTTGSDGLFVFSTAPVNATGTSADLTAADANMGGLGQTAIRESLWVSVEQYKAYPFV